MDAWYRGSGERELNPWRWRRIEHFVVPQEAQGEAQLRLEDRAAVELESGEAAGLLGKAIRPPRGTTLFLLRGVALNEDTGEFSVYSRGLSVWVHHGSLGRRPVSMKRKALIAALRRSPDEVFVTCMMEE